MTDCPACPDAAAPHAAAPQRISWRGGRNLAMFSAYAYGYAMQPCRARKNITSRSDLPSRRNTCLNLQSSRALPSLSAWALAPSIRTRPRPSTSNPCPHPSMSSLSRPRVNTDPLTRCPRICGAHRASCPDPAQGARFCAHFSWRPVISCARLVSSCPNTLGALKSFAASRRMTCRKLPPLSPLELSLFLAPAPSTKPPSRSLRPSMWNQCRSRVSNPTKSQARGQALLAGAVPC